MHGFVDTRNLRIHYLDFGGSGRSVVCLHGVTAHAWSWAGVVDALTSIRRVVAIDMRGHGDSQWSDQEHYSTLDHASDLEALVRLLPSPVDLIGASWGGLVARAFSLRNVKLVERVALVDTPASFSQGETDVPDRPDSFASHSEAVAWERSANPNAPSEMVEIMASFGTRPMAHGRLARKHDTLFLRRWPFRSDDRWDELALLEMPVLLVHADSSYVLTLEMAEKMVSALPQGRLVNVPASGHAVHVENPVALSAALLEFLNDD